MGRRREDFRTKVVAAAVAHHWTARRSDIVVSRDVKW